MRVAAYLRCSTDSQELDVQRDELQRAAEARGWQIAEWYEDRAQSGAKESRPALDALRADARRRRFDVVLVQRLDRLARSVRQLVELAQELEGAGVDLCAARQAIDTTTPGGKLTFHVLAAVAEFERDLIRERVRAGVARAMRQPRPGKRRPGRPRTAVDVEAARRLLEAGASVAAVAERMGIPRTTLRRRLA
jgi:DNA invertase Pin-like site-specific DNA recombinase